MNANEEPVLAEALEIHDLQERAAYLDRACASERQVKAIGRAARCRPKDGVPIRRDTLRALRKRFGKHVLL